MDKEYKILLAEDDENLGMLLREYLINRGYDTDLVVDGEQGYKAFSEREFDICILDVMMPKKDGFALAKEIRMVNSEIPIIFLTAKTMKEDVFQGFKMGADDYITKPFSMEELLLRLEAILRRTKGGHTSQEVFHLGRYMFDTQKQQLVDGESVIKLTTKESDLLKLLCNNAN